MTPAFIVKEIYMIYYIALKFAEGNGKIKYLILKYLLISNKKALSNNFCATLFFSKIYKFTVGIKSVRAQTGNS